MSGGVALEDNGYTLVRIMGYRILVEAGLAEVQGQVVDGLPVVASEIQIFLKQKASVAQAGF